MNKPVYLGLSILELSKILIYEFWYDYVKPKYDKKTKLCYIDTDSFIVYLKTDDIYKDIEEDVEIKLDTSYYKLDRTLPKGKSKTTIGLKKDELGGKIMTKFVGLRAKTYIYLIRGGSEDETAKDTKIYVILIKIKFENYKSCLEATQYESNINYLEKKKLTQIVFKKNHKEFIKNYKTILKTQQRLKSKRRNIFTEEINNIALSSNVDKILQSIDSIETYAHGTSRFQ